MESSIGGDFICIDSNGSSMSPAPVSRRSDVPSRAYSDEYMFVGMHPIDTASLETARTDVPDYWSYQQPSRSCSSYNDAQFSNVLIPGVDATAVFSKMVALSDVHTTSSPTPRFNHFGCPLVEYFRSTERLEKVLGMLRLERTCDSSRPKTLSFTLPFASVVDSRQESPCTSPLSATF